VAVALLVGLTAVTGVLGVGVVTAPAAAAATSCAGPLADGQIRVVLVVDPGEGGPRGPQATCLVVKAGTSGSAILAQRASELGLPSPRYAPSGLLCGLDGYPATGCPVNTSGTYAYWAYFNASGGSWAFGHDNPFVRRMGDGEIMGWRYTGGSVDGAAPTPRIAPSSSLFPPLAPTASPAPSGGAGGGAPSVPGGGGSGGGGGAAAPADGPGIPDLSGLTTTTVPTEDAEVSTTESSAPASSEQAGGDVPAGDGTADEAPEELAVAPVGSTGGDGGATRWLGPVLVIAVAGALGIGAVARTRRRGRVGG